VNLSADTYLNTENNVNNKGNSQNTGSNIVAFTDFIIKEIPGGIGIVGEIIGTKGAKAAATVVGTVITFGSNTALYEGKYKNEGDPIGKVVVASSVKTGLDVLEDVAITSAVSAAVSAVVVGSAPVSIPVLIISATVLLVIDGISNAATGEDLTEKLADELMLPEENSGNTVNTISNGTKSKLGKVVVPTLSPIPGWQLEK
jgi:hypothetical protein